MYERGEEGWEQEEREREREGEYKASDGFGGERRASIALFSEDGVLKRPRHSRFNPTHLQCACFLCVFAIHRLSQDPSSLELAYVVCAPAFVFVLDGLPRCCVRYDIVRRLSTRRTELCGTHCTYGNELPARGLLCVPF